MKTKRSLFLLVVPQILRGPGHIAHVLIVLILFCLSGLTALAQGTLIFANNLPGILVTHIYGPDPYTFGFEETGNGPNDFPAGGTVYGGTPIGGSSGTSSLATLDYSHGNEFTAQIYAIAHPGPGVVPFSSLQAVSQYITTLSTSTPGFIVPVNPPNDPGIPNTGYNGATGTIDNRAVVSLAAWYNAGGTITSIAAASVVGVPYAYSTPFNLNGLGEPASVETAYNGSPSTGTAAAAMSGLTSFSFPNFNTPLSTPEPGTLALLLVGGAVAAFRQRREKGK